MINKREQLLEELLENFQAIKNSMHAKMISGKGRTVTYSQQLALLTIAHGKSVGIKEVSSTFCVSSSAVTQLVNELVDQGYVVRKTNANDRRALNLTLSKKGQAQVALLKKRHVALLGTVFAKLSDRELGQFLRLQKKILAHVAQA